MYDAAGRVVETIAPDGTSARTTYDDSNVVKATTDAEGNTVAFEHDKNGNVTAVTDAKNHTTRFEYDDADRLIKRTDPLGAYEAYGYDAMGRIKSHVDRRGLETEYRYDALGRTKFVGYGKSGENFESSLTYEYDEQGRLKSVADSTSGAGTIGFEYDDLDRMVKEIGPQGDISYSYDAGGRLKTMSEAGKAAVGYEYYANDLLKSVTRGSEVSTFVYDAASRMTSKTLPGGITATYGYDRAGQIKAIDYDKGSEFVGNVTYRLDLLGRRTQVAGTLAETQLPKAESGMAYDQANRLTTNDGKTLKYDASGDLIDDEANTYSWNARGQLVSVTEPSGTSRLGYDPLGRRTSTLVGGLTTGFRFDGNELIGQHGSDGTDSTFINGLGHDDVLTRVDSTGAVSGYLRDALGSTIGLTDSAGALKTQYGYDLFGNSATTGTADSNPVRWTGRVSGPSMPAGLQDNRNRLYSTELRRFISEDPIGFEGGYNLYEYAGSNPVDNSDPDGTSWFTGGLAGCALAAAGSAYVGYVTGRKQGWDYVTGGLEGCAWAAFGGALGAWKGARGLRAARSGAIDDIVGEIGRLGRAACSFASDTPVVMADGTTRQIRNIDVGDRVIATDPITGEHSKRVVIAVSAHKDRLVRLDVSGVSVRTTDDHPFWSVEKKAWIGAGSLKRGDRLLSLRGGLPKVGRIDAERYEVDDAYNLSVRGPHTYHVADLGLLVHNACPGMELAAAKLVQLNGGRNRVFIRTPNGAFTLDLAGKAHFDKLTGRYIPTPHVKWYTLHSGPNGTSMRGGRTREATWDDLRIARAYLERKGS